MSAYKDSRAAPVILARYGTPHICQAGGPAAAVIIGNSITLQTPLPEVLPAAWCFTNTKLGRGCSYVKFTTESAGEIVAELFYE